MKKRQLFLAFVLAFALILGQGCTTTTVTGPEGQTDAVYKLGKLTAEEPRDISTVYQAAEKALAELELSISQKLKDEIAAKIIARDSQDKKITLALLALTEDSTKITISAGSFVKARRIYQKIHQKMQGGVQLK
jgi:hypothetical protein